MISRRYLGPLVVLLAIALVPTVIHQYLGLDEDDGRHLSAVPERLAGLAGRPTDRRKAYGRAVFGAYEWFEREYLGGGRQVRLFAARGFDQKRLYHHPEIALSRGVDLAPPQLVTLPGDPPLQVHLMWEKDGRGLAAYVLLYGDRSIADPVANQLRHAVWQLFHPRRPMTLFYVSDAHQPRRAGFENSLAAKVLREAVNAFLDQGARRP